MKKAIIAIAFWAASVGAFAQGQVNFSSINFFTTGSSASEPAVYDVGGLTRLDGANFKAQLYWGAATWTGTASGASIGTAPISFFSVADGAPGFFDGGAATVGVAANTSVFVQVRAWNTAAGATYEAAAASPLGRIGSSAVLALTAGGGTVTPPNLNGLAKFSLVPTVVPEPTTIALGILGAGALLLRRRK